LCIRIDGAARVRARIDAHFFKLRAQNNERAGARSSVVMNADDGHGLVGRMIAFLVPIKLTTNDIRISRIA